MHIIHAAFAIVASIAFVLMTFLATLTFFKCAQTATDASAKSDSRSDISRFIQKTIVVYAFTFLNQDDQQWFLIFLFLVLSALTFERYFYLHSYYDEGI
jgi:hypothetical protein